MTWTSNDIANLILVGKDVSVHLAESVCRKLDLGQPLGKDIDILMYLNNMVFALEHASTITTSFEDADYSYINEMINRIEIQRNRFRGI
jgi:hypothetical protein